MSFFTSLSGLQASQTDMATISHNLANVATNGFKKSRTEFADVIASNRGRLIKSIGDSVLFVNPDPVAAYDTAEGIINVIGRDPRMPDVRTDVRVSVIYYSATGGVYALAQQAVEAAEKAGAEVRLRKVRELAPARPTLAEIFREVVR